LHAHLQNVFNLFKLSHQTSRFATARKAIASLLSQVNRNFIHYLFLHLHWLTNKQKSLWKTTSETSFCFAKTH